MKMKSIFLLILILEKYIKPPENITKYITPSFLNQQLIYKRKNINIINLILFRLLELKRNIYLEAINNVEKIKYS
tara:strand:- start:58 stop:282 length:225 start_codon:yes stop_codon:yes gene_type:complete